MNFPRDKKSLREQKNCIDNQAEKCIVISMKACDYNFTLIQWKWTHWRYQLSNQMSETRSIKFHMKLSADSSARIVDRNLEHVSIHSESSTRCCVNNVWKFYFSF